MPQHSASWSRRQVMIGAAGFTFALALDGVQPAAAAAIATGREIGPGSRPMGQYRAGWAHLHHVAGRRNGAGLDDIASAHRGRRTRCGLGQSADRAGAAD